MRPHCDALKQKKGFQTAVGQATEDDHYGDFAKRRALVLSTSDVDTAP
jgi:hypothetical protein